MDQQSCSLGGEPSLCGRPDHGITPRGCGGLSGEAQSFGDILQKLRGMDDVRSERVEALAAHTADGSYAPSSSDIAAKMLAMRY